MEMIPIPEDRSTQIEEIGHEGVDLCHVQFRRGALYEFGEIHLDLFQKFRDAAKPGEFFRAHIKGKKPYRKIAAKKPETRIDEIVERIDAALNRQGIETLHAEVDGGE
jgi:KTSC domain